MASELNVGGITTTGNVGVGVDNPSSKLSVGDNNPATLKATVSITDEVAGGSLAIRGQAPTIFMDSTSSGIPKILMDARGIEFRAGNIDGEGASHFTIASSGLATFANGIVVGNTNTGPIPGDYIHSNTAVSVAASSSFTLTVGSGLIIIYDTGGYGAVFWAEYGSITTKLSGNAFFDVSGGTVNVSKSAGTATVTVANAHASTRYITVLVLAGKY